MKRTLIALFATAALAMPAAAQQQNPNQNSGQAQNTGQDQSAGQNQGGGQDQSADQSDPSQGGQSGSIHLTRAQTRMLQQALNSQGLNAGRADGVIGPQTRQALQKYQSGKGLNASGEVDRQTVAALLGERGKRTASQKGSSQGTPSQDQHQGSQGPSR